MQFANPLRSTLFLLLSFAFSIQAVGQTKSTDVEEYLKSQGLVNVQIIEPSLWVDLKYATTDNFTQGILYENMPNRAYAHPYTAEKLSKAQQYLKDLHPQLSLLVYDIARPLSVQRSMYEVVRNTPFHAYVAHPDKTGLHNYALAVDLTICDKSGLPLDMGTDFDFFGKAAGINLEDELIETGVLTNQQVKNRRLLRKIMTKAGFFPIRGEWWHFNTVSLSEAKKKYKVIE